MDLLSALTTTPGQKLWIVARMVNADRATNYVAIDMLRNTRQLLRRSIDLAFDATHDWRVLQHRGGVWTDRSAYADNGLFGIFEVAGDVSGGQAVYQTNVANTFPNEGGDSTPAVDATYRFRQRWTPAVSETITRVYVCAGSNNASAPLTLTVRQGASVLHTATVPTLPTITQSGKNFETVAAEIDWRYVDMPGGSVVSGGTPVYFELSTTGSGSYEIGAYPDGQRVSYFSAGGFPNGGAESSASGGSWTEVPNGSHLAVAWIVV